MKTLITLLTCLLVMGCLSAQDNPRIGTEKGVKEKLIRIKNGLPDMKKNLARKDEMWVDQYNVKFEMGNGMVLFNEDDGAQSLKIRYSTSYFSGSITDFQNYYRTLVALTQEVFGTTYYSKSVEKQKEWETSFYQKGKDVFNSPVWINISCDWIFDSLGPDIEIEVFSRVKAPAKKKETEEDEY